MQVGYAVGADGGNGDDMLKMPTTEELDAVVELVKAGRKDDAFTSLESLALRYNLRSFEFHQYAQEIKQRAGIVEPTYAERRKALKAAQQLA
jgi:hypothetical protein